MWLLVSYGTLINLRLVQNHVEVLAVCRRMGFLTINLPRCIIEIFGLFPDFDSSDGISIHRHGLQYSSAPNLETIFSLLGGFFIGSFELLLENFHRLLGFALGSMARMNQGDLNFKGNIVPAVCLFAIPKGPLHV